MAIVACITTCDVRRMLTDGDGAVVTRHTSPDDLCMVDSIGRCPHRVIVAVLAYVGGIDMRLVFARRISTVVTANTIVCYARMIKNRRSPGNGRMTGIAIVRTCHVRRMFPGCNAAIVASEAGSQDLRVID